MRPRHLTAPHVGMGVSGRRPSPSLPRQRACGSAETYYMLLCSLAARSYNISCLGEAPSCPSCRCPIALTWQRRLSFSRRIVCSPSLVRSCPRPNPSPHMQTMRGAAVTVGDASIAKLGKLRKLDLLSVCFLLLLAPYANTMNSAGEGGVRAAQAPPTVLVAEEGHCLPDSASEFVDFECVPMCPPELPSHARSAHCPLPP
jgi:hypothetical protein